MWILKGSRNCHDCSLVRLYNEERLVDKSRVTCVKWVPGKGDTFLVSHASGHLYTYQVGTWGVSIMAAERT